MKTVLTTIAVVGLALVGISSIRAEALVQVRLTHETYGPGYERLELLHKTDATDEGFREVLFVDKRMLLEKSHIKSAELNKAGEDQERIVLQLSAEGVSEAARLKRSANKKIALVVNGQPVAAATLGEMSAGGAIAMNGDFTEEEGRAIVKHINEALAQR